MTKVVVLDRDGVINADSPDYIKSASEWTALPHSLEAIAKFSRAGFAVIVASNQSGLGRGLFDLDALEEIHQKIQTNKFRIHNEYQADQYSNAVNCNQAQRNSFLKMYRQPVGNAVFLTDCRGALR